MKRLCILLVVLGAILAVLMLGSRQLGIPRGGQEPAPVAQEQTDHSAVSSDTAAGEPGADDMAPAATAATEDLPPAADEDGGMEDAGDGADSSLLPEDMADGLPDEAVVHGTVEKGDTLSSVLEGAGGQRTLHYADAVKQVFSLRAFRTGQPYVVVTDRSSGQVKRFEYEIDNNRRLVVEGMEDPVARVEAIEYTLLLSVVEAEISDNLFQAVADVGEGPQLAIRLAELFGSEINFLRDIQPGDSFSVLVEKRYRDGEDKGYGRILAATFTNQGKLYEAFLFRDGRGKAQYYNRKGENLRKTLLQAPLSFTRITSRFTNSRRHPILGYSRPHLGVDYGAPTGTPVKAVGDGVVIKRGWGGGYGNQIVIRHTAGLESWYAHLSGYARGLRTGQRVRQGQVIGFVGSTGLSTGPHLDFRIRQNGKFVNPVKAINPRGKAVSASSMKRFRETVALETAFLAGEKSLADYASDSIVPPDQLEELRSDSEAEEARPARRKGR